MGDTTSRYGIMEELNSQKLQEKQKLFEMEKQKELTISENEETIAQLEKEIQSKDATYEDDFKRWKQKKEINIKLNENEFKRNVEQAKEEIKNFEDNYEESHDLWKEGKEKELQDLIKSKERFDKTKNAEIEAKKELIEEIDKGIDSIKEVSKDQTTKE